MAKRFDLSKGDRFTLTKDMGLELIRADLTWKSQADLDAEAFLLGDDGLIIEDADFVYYKSAKRTPLPKEGQSDKEYLEHVKETPYDRNEHGSKKRWLAETAPLSFDESVVGSFDDLGQEEDSDQESGETIRVNLMKVRPGIEEIVFTVTIHHEGNNNYTFKDVQDARIVITNAETGDELCSYALNEAFTTEDAVVVGSLRLNDDGEWEFEAIGKGYNGGLETLVEMFT